MEKASVWICRRYDGKGRAAPWLITIEIGCDHGIMAAYPHARAVIDDFGTLVIVGGWN